MIGRIDLKQINRVLPQLLSTILSASVRLHNPLKYSHSFFTWSQINHVLVVILSVTGNLIQMKKYVQLE